MRKLADDNLRILSEAAAIHPTAYSQEKSSLIPSRVDQDSSPAQSFNDDSQSTSPKEPVPLKLKRPYTKYAKLTPKKIELINKDLMSGKYSNPKIADRQGVSLATVSNIRRKLKKRPIGERGNLKESHAPLTPKKIELIKKELMSGKYPNPEIAHRHGVSLATVSNIKQPLMKRPIGERGNLREYYRTLTPKLEGDITKDLMSRDFFGTDIAYKYGVSKSTVSRIKGNILGLNLLRKRRLSGERILRPPVDRRLSPPPSTSQEQPANQQHVAGNEASLLDNSLRH
ncbi:MAG: hypothetical protein KZQ84_19600 [Candidatus Thiodiazotropha sp. (ex Lucinoma borealis)]|nr:hypothetical protein [Candidatus Thiodiazotropha sp. (ex Lucinoma borealis)]